MNRKKLFISLLALAICLSLLTACVPAKPPVETDGPEDASQTQNPDFSDQGPVWTAVKSVGDFTTQDINGNTVTQDIFKEHKLTMVNVFTTWCTPCVNEMPDLEKLHQQVKEQDVGVIGVVLDVLNEKGEIVDEDLKRAQRLVEETGVTYPILLPDSTYFHNRLIGLEAFPETFFVDENGNIVGESYCGSAGLEDWTEVVKTELANLKAGA